MVDPLSCPHCNQPFNAEEKAPLLLVPCGCTLCSSCLSGLRDGGNSNGESAVVICPLDNQESHHTCLNQALLRQVMEPLSWDEGLTHLRARAKDLIGGLLNQKSDLERVMKEVVKVQVAVAHKKATIEQSIRAATEEAIQAVMQLQESMLHEVSAATAEKEAQLSAQVQDLTGASQSLELMRGNLEVSLTSQRPTDLVKALSAASVTLEELKGATSQPVVEDDLVYQDTGATERKELLARLVARPSSKGSVWGKLEKKVVSLSRVVGMVGSVGQGEGNFQYPYHVALDDERVYISDFGNNRIVVMDKQSLRQVQMIDGSEGWSSKRLKHPSGIAVDHDRIYVAESNSHAVRALDKKTGVQVWRVGGKSGAGEGQFHSPRQVLANDKFLLVSDYSNRRIVVLDKETGAHVRYLGGADADLGTPEGLCFDPQHPDQLFVSDYEGHRILVISLETGRRIRAFGTVGWSGDGNHHFNNPLGVAVAGQYIFIADRGNARVQVLNKETGNYVTTVGQTGRPGAAEDLYDKPNGLATDGQRLYITEWNNHRLKVVML